jgi:aliphatic nitrilase
MQPAYRKISRGAAGPHRYFPEFYRRKQQMDSRGHYARPELLSLSIDLTSTTHLPERVANPAIEAVRDTEIL